MQRINILKRTNSWTCEVIIYCFGMLRGKEWQRESAQVKGQGRKYGVYSQLRPSRIIAHLKYF